MSIFNVQKGLIVHLLIWAAILLLFYFLHVLGCSIALQAQNIISMIQVPK